MHISLIQVRRENLDVSATTVNLLLMLDRKLNYQGLSLIAERIKTSGGSVKPSVLTCLET